MQLMVSFVEGSATSDLLDKAWPCKTGDFRQLAECLHSGQSWGVPGIFNKNKISAQLFLSFINCDSTVIPGRLLVESCSLVNFVIFPTLLIFLGNAWRYHRREGIIKR